MHSAVTRRSFLHDSHLALFGVGLAGLLRRERGALADATGGAHHPPKAQRVLQIFCPGGVSHMDLWENKPELENRDGEPMPGAENFFSFQGKNGSLMKSPWPFVPCGESGKRHHLSSHKSVSCEKPRDQPP